MGKVRYQLAQTGNRDHVIEIHTVVFKITEVEYSYPKHIINAIAEEWKRTAQGKFITEHAIEGSLDVTEHADYSRFDYRIVAKFEIEAKKLTEFYLRWGNPNGNN
jgi:hypothetical protein